VVYVQCSKFYDHCVGEHIELSVPVFVYPYIITNTSAKLELMNMPHDESKYYIQLLPRDRFRWVDVPIHDTRGFNSRLLNVDMYGTAIDLTKLVKQSMKHPNVRDRIFYYRPDGEIMPIATHSSNPLLSRPLCRYPYFTSGGVGTKYIYVHRMQYETRTWKKRRVMDNHDDTSSPFRPPVPKVNPSSHRWPAPIRHLWIPYEATLVKVKEKHFLRENISNCKGKKTNHCLFSQPLTTRLMLLDIMEQNCSGYDSIFVDEDHSSDLNSIYFFVHYGCLNKCFFSSVIG
jgi:hypothetical protein